MDARLVGANIKAYRVEAGLTQAELAERVHVSRQIINYWENGRGLPETRIVDVAAALVRPVADFHKPRQIAGGRTCVRQNHREVAQMRYEMEKTCTQ